MKKQNKRNIKKNRGSITNRAKSTFRKSERKVGKGLWSEFFVLKVPGHKNAVQTATIAYLGEEEKEGQMSKVYYASVMSHPFNIYVTPIDFSRGELTVTKTEGNDLADLESCIPYIQALTELFRQQGLTGCGISTDQLMEEMKDPKKEFIHASIVS